MKPLALALMLLILSGLAATQAPRFQFTHKGSVLRVKFSPSGTRLFSYSSGNQDIAVWEVLTGNLLWKRPISFIQKADEYYTLESFAWSPDEKLVATGSANGTLQLWNVDDGQFVWRADVAKTGLSAIAFSPDGKTIAATGFGPLGAAAILVSVSNGSIVKDLIGERCEAVGIAFDASGSELNIGNLDGNVVRWDLDKGTPIRKVDCKNSYSYAGERSFSEDLTLSVRRTTANQFVIQNSDGEVLKTIPLNASKLESVINARVRKAVVAKYGGYVFYDLATGDEKTLDDCISGSAFDLSANGRFFAQSCDGFKTAIRITDFQSDKSWTLDGHPSKINSIAYSPDFSLLAVAGNDGNAYLFDPETRTVKLVLRGTDTRLTSLAFSPDGKQLITGDEKNVLRRWDLSTGKSLDEVKVIYDRSDDIEKIAVSADGNHTIVLINSAVFLLDGDLKIKGTLKTPEGYSSTSGNMTVGYSSVPTKSAVFNIDGKQVITAHPDGTLRFWDVSTTRQTRKLKAADSLSFVAPIDATRVLVLGSTGKKARFLVVDTRNGKRLRQSGVLDPSYLEKMFLSPDKRVAAVTDISGDTVLCDLDKMLLRNLDYPLSGQDSVAFSGDGTAFFIGGANQNLSFYDTKSLKKQWSLLPEFAPREAEMRLEKERDLRVAEIEKKKKVRDREGVAYVAANRRKVYVSFEHYGDMTDPGEKRMVEPSELNESKNKKSANESNAVWLRLHNDSKLPIEVPTESMHLPNPKCFHQFPNGEKLSGLCKDQEIGLQFGVKDRQNKWVPYGFDFGSSVMLLPGTSVLFPVPLKIWNKTYSVVFNYSFQNTRASENDREMDFGPNVELKVNRFTAPAR